MYALLLIAAFCGQFELELALALTTPQQEQQNVITDHELQPEVPDLTPEPPRFVSKQVQRSETYYAPKYCRGRICGYIPKTRTWTETVQVPVSQQPTNTSQISSSADTYATPLDAAKRILESMWTGSRATLLDLGSGDGRMVVEWARWTGSPAIGIESDPKRVAQSRAFAESRGVSHLVTFIEDDFTKIAWPAADVIYLYQFPDVMVEVAGRLKHYDRVVSFSHEVPGLAMKSHNGGEFYSWRKLQPIQSKPVAYWNGRAYTAPVCNKPGCTMCATIRAQLGM
jgi:precorrin-6B methylase 2